MFDRRAYPVPLPSPQPVDRAVAQPVPFPPKPQAALLPYRPPVQQAWQQRLNAMQPPTSRRPVAPPRWGQRPAPAVSPSPTAERFNQRGRPIPSQANLTGNQMNTWQQRMAGKQGAAVTNGKPMAAMQTQMAGQQRQSLGMPKPAAPQTSPTPGFLPRGRSGN